jgi:hypothetical protein
VVWREAGLAAGGSGGVAATGFGGARRPGPIGDDAGADCADRWGRSLTLGTTAGVMTVGGGGDDEDDEHAARTDATTTPWNAEGNGATIG